MNSSLSTMESTRDCVTGGLVGWVCNLLSSLGVIRKVEVPFGQEGVVKGAACDPSGSLPAPKGRASFEGSHGPLEFSKEAKSAFSEVVTPGIQDLTPHLFYRVVSIQSEWQGDHIVSFQESGK
jgi:hypothetical protein